MDFVVVVVAVSVYAVRALTVAVAVIVSAIIGTGKVAAVAVLIDAVTADLLSAFMDRRSVVVAVTAFTARALAVTVAVTILTARAGDIGAVAILVDAVAADLVGLGVNGGIAVVAIDWRCAAVASLPAVAVAVVAGTLEVRAVAVLVDAVTATLFGAGIDIDSCVVAVSLTRTGPAHAEAVAVLVVAVRTDLVAAIAVLVHIVAADLFRVGMDVRIVVVAVVAAAAGADGVVAVAVLIAGRRAASQLDNVVVLHAAITIHDDVVGLTGSSGEGRLGAAEDQAGARIALTCDIGNHEDVEVGGHVADFHRHDAISGGGVGVGVLGAGLVPADTAVFVDSVSRTGGAVVADLHAVALELQTRLAAESAVDLQGELTGVAAVSVHDDVVGPSRFGVEGSDVADATVSQAVVGLADPFGVFEDEHVEVLAGRERFQNRRDIGGHARREGVGHLRPVFGPGGAGILIDVVRRVGVGRGGGDRGSAGDLARGHADVQRGTRDGEVVVADRSTEAIYRDVVESAGRGGPGGSGGSAGHGGGGIAVPVARGVHHVDIQIRVHAGELDGVVARHWRDEGVGVLGSGLAPANTSGGCTVAGPGVVVDHVRAADAIVAPRNLVTAGELGSRRAAPVELAVHVERVSTLVAVVAIDDDVVGVPGLDVESGRHTTIGEAGRGIASAALAVEHEDVEVHTGIHARQRDSGLALGRRGEGVGVFGPGFGPARAGVPDESVRVPSPVVGPGVGAAALDVSRRLATYGEVTFHSDVELARRAGVTIDHEVVGLPLGNAEGHRIVGAPGVPARFDAVLGVALALGVGEHEEVEVGAQTGNRDGDLARARGDESVGVLTRLVAGRGCAGVARDFLGRPEIVVRPMIRITAGQCPAGRTGLGLGGPCRAKRQQER